MPGIPVVLVAPGMAVVFVAMVLGPSLFAAAASAVTRYVPVARSVIVAHSVVFARSVLVALVTAVPLPAEAVDAVGRHVAAALPRRTALFFSPALVYCGSPTAAISYTLDCTLDYTLDCTLDYTLDCTLDALDCTLDCVVATCTVAYSISGAAYTGNYGRCNADGGVCARHLDHGSALYD